MSLNLMHSVVFYETTIHINATAIFFPLSLLLLSGDNSRQNNDVAPIKYAVMCAGNSN